MIIISSLANAVQAIAHTRPKLYGVVGCFSITATYVGLLYVWRRLPRKHPTAIKKRMVSVVAACSVSWIPIALREGHVRIHHLLGLSLSRIPGCMVRPLKLTGLLFCGPLVFRLCDSDFHESLFAAFDWVQRLISRSWIEGDWQGAIFDPGLEPFADEHLTTWRNLVISPIAEEFCFRACMCPLLITAFGMKTTVLITPLFFGAAHLHHLHDLVRFQKVPLKKAAILVTFQFAYTTVFGWFETFVFLKTGSILPPIFIHSFCNWLGFPDIRRMKEQSGGSALIPLGLLSVGAASFAIALRKIGVAAIKT